MFKISEGFIHIPPILLMLFLVTGIYKLLVQEEVTNEINKIRRKIAEDKVATNIIRKTGIDITSKEYYRFLFLVSVIILAAAAVNTFLRKDLGILLAGIIAIVLILWIFRPCEYIFGTVKSPFMIIVDFLTKRKREQMDNEIFSSCIILKNIAIVQRSKKTSADRIFEILARSAKSLKPVYNTMLSMYRTGQKDEAFNYFNDAIRTTNARTFTAIISKIDRISPSELEEQISSLLENVSQKRVTIGYKRAQKNGMITIALATTAVLLVLSDVLVISLFMDMITSFSTIF